jgi:hypothetical protein
VTFGDLPGTPVRGHLSDTATTRQEVVIRLYLRRLFCDNTACPRRTFDEQVPELAERHARRTTVPHRVDVLAYVERSPAAMRSFDRHLIKLTELSDDEVDALRDQRDRQLDQIAQDLIKQTRSREPRSSGLSSQRRVNADEESSWEDGTWMERA